MEMQQDSSLASQAAQPAAGTAETCPTDRVDAPLQPLRQTLAPSELRTNCPPDLPRAHRAAVGPPFQSGGFLAHEEDEADDGMDLTPPLPRRSVDGAVEGMDAHAAKRRRAMLGAMDPGESNGMCVSSALLRQQEPN
eukprot:scaffold310098_cov39-Tisochrysis_lutea.AAC.2